MRATLRLTLICATIAYIAFLKYYAGPVELVRTQQDFVLDMMAHGARPAMQPAPQNEKIRYISQPAPPGARDPEDTEDYWGQGIKTISATSAFSAVK